jgi:hypothetical protein
MPTYASFPSESDIKKKMKDAKLAHPPLPRIFQGPGGHGPVLTRAAGHSR